MNYDHAVLAIKMALVYSGLYEAVKFDFAVCISLLHCFAQPIYCIYTHCFPQSNCVDPSLFCLLVPLVWSNLFVLHYSAVLISVLPQVILLSCCCRLPCKDLRDPVHTQMVSAEVLWSSQSSQLNAGYLSYVCEGVTHHSGQWCWQVGHSLSHAPPSLAL